MASRVASPYVASFSFVMVKLCAPELRPLTPQLMMVLMRFCDFVAITCWSISNLNRLYPEYCTVGASADRVTFTAVLSNVTSALLEGHENKIGRASATACPLPPPKRPCQRNWMGDAAKAPVESAPSSTISIASLTIEFALNTKAAERLFFLLPGRRIKQDNNVSLMAFGLSAHLGLIVLPILS